MLLRILKSRGCVLPQDLDEGVSQEHEVHRHQHQQQLQQQQGPFMQQGSSACAVANGTKDRSTNMASANGAETPGSSDEEQTDEPISCKREGAKSAQLSPEQQHQLLARLKREQEEKEQEEEHKKVSDCAALLGTKILCVRIAVSCCVLAHAASRCSIMQSCSPACTHMLFVQTCVCTA